MDESKLQKVRDTLAAGDSEKAAKMLRWVLKNEPSADAWVLASAMVEDDEQKITLLRRALAMDNMHSTANRMLMKLEGAKPTSATVTGEWQSKVGEKPVDDIKREGKKDRFQRHAQRQRNYSRIGCICGIIFSLSFTFAMVRAIGLMTPFLTKNMAFFLGRPTPFTDSFGVPLSELKSPSVVMTPSLQEKASGQDMEILDDGYMHEHFFDASSGQEYAIYVQFLSVNANNVPRNVFLVDPDGKDQTKTCDAGNILKGGNNITITCVLTKSGRWTVRIVGRDGESVGAYFIGVEKLDF